jgi:hypothetical protein
VVERLAAGGWDDYRREARADIRRIAGRYQLEVPKLREQRERASTYALSLRSRLERLETELDAVRAQLSERGTGSPPDAPSLR